MKAARRREQGFTLAEAVVVIAITGIVAAMVAVFVRKPVEGYLDSARRAELTDIADTALRRIARDLRTALPNSVRAGGGGLFLEYLETRTGGRYREDETCFSSGCSSLVTLGDIVPSTPAIAAGSDRIVIYNLYNNSAADCSSTNPSAYCGQNTSIITSASDGGNEDTLSFASTTFVPTGGSPGKRFQVISGPVSYACDQATNTLWRYWNYPVQAVQPAAIATLNGLSGVQKARLATNVDCGAGRTQFNYDPGATERSGLVSMRLYITQSGETVSLDHEVHVSNVP